MEGVLYDITTMPQESSKGPQSKSKEVVNIGVFFTNTLFYTVDMNLLCGSEL